MKLKEKWGFIDKTGKLAIPLQFDWAAGPWVTGTWGFSDGLAPVQQGKKWGFIDKNGKMVIPPRYNGALKFSEGLAAVLLGEEDAETEPWGFIDKTGKMVIPAQFRLPLDPPEGRFAEFMGVFSGGLAEVLLDPGTARVERTGYVDHTGKFVWIEKNEPALRGNASPEMKALKVDLL